MPRRLLASLLAFLASAALASPPHLDARGLAAYQDFLAAAPARAFAIAPGGGYAWIGEAASAEDAEERALAHCRRQSEQTCLLYAVDARKVFDAKRWPTLWGPYPDTATSARAPIGMRRGMRFPDLQLRDAAGRSLRLSDLRGKVLLLHFWGSWCGHCRREMPDLQRLSERLGKARVAFILIQVREDAERARAWLRRENIRLPHYDGGARGADDTHLRLADGGTLADRAVARAFPATYVLGRHGTVLFSHTGPVADWSQYAAFLKHAAH